ncbi:MAG: hypothetical protein EP335_12805 [Alphaproteobacteria bacterium]|nr:MAG: hypothetical protein EP335_12805 [Alphaproteobacteria bacterium]
MKQRVIWSTVLMLALAAGNTLADDDKEPTRAEKRLANVMEKYEATGEVRHCIPLRFLRESTIIDDQTIFFRGLGKKGYMVHLPYRCSRLAAEERFAYRNSIGQLCKSDIITVLDSFGREWGSCGLGEFEEMKKKPRSADKDDADQGDEPDEDGTGR